MPRSSPLGVEAWKRARLTAPGDFVNHYRLDGEDPSIVASGHTVFDLGLARPLRRWLELNLSFDNLTSRDYYETQNYFDSRMAPYAPILGRIHGTPGYPLTAVVGLTFRLRGK